MWVKYLLIAYIGLNIAVDLVVIGYRCAENEPEGIPQKLLGLLIHSLFIWGIATYWV